MDGTTVRHIDPRLLQVLEFLDDAAHRAAGLISKLLGRRIERPLLVEMRHGRRPKLLVHRALHKMRRKDVDEIVEPCPGIYDLLDFLKERDVVMGLVSNGLGKGYGHDILKTFDLEKYFSATIFREDIRRSKPHPDPLLQALEQIGRAVSTSDVIWYFGDRPKDVKAAVAAQAHLPCPVVPFAYGLNPAMALLESNHSVENIVIAWPDLLARLRPLF